ncbi:unnamed protein product [Sphagnum balticum]
MVRREGATDVRESAGRQCQGAALRPRYIQYVVLFCLSSNRKRKFDLRQVAGDALGTTIDPMLKIIHDCNMNRHQIHLVLAQLPTTSLSIDQKNVTPVGQEIDDPRFYRRDLFEGDIANPGLNASNVNEFVKRLYLNPLPFDNSGEEDVRNRSARNSVRSENLLWPKARVPYTLSDKFTSEQ